jgi:hypothetical protein
VIDKSQKVAVGIGAPCMRVHKALRERTQKWKKKYNLQNFKH